MGYIDSHAHVDGERFNEDRAEVLARARAGEIELILEICNGDIEQGSLEAGVALATEYPFIYAAVGVHPHDAKLWDEALEARLRRLAATPKVIAWGEIGLDYYYNHSDPAVQRRVFRRQLELATELQLPVVIHSREANEETIEILREYQAGRAQTGVFHCFSGDAVMAEQALALGFMISFAGNVTFKKAAALREVAKQVPLDRILIETDCPFMTPEPFRGRRNEPIYVREVARQLGELHNLPAEEIGRLTTANFKRFYGLAG